MSEHKTVTPDMIDDELVHKIYVSPIFLDNTHEGSNKTIDSEYIRAVLAYLANNPIVPSEEEAKTLERDWNKEPSIDDYKDNASTWCAIEWQRRAYLKKEPQIDPELHSMLIGLSSDVKKIARAAYEMGAKNGGKK